MEKQQELFEEWLKNLDSSFDKELEEMDGKFLVLLNMAFQEGYEKGYKDKLKFNYEEWNQK